MNKASEEQLLEEVSEHLSIYLKDGKICLDSFVHKTDPTLRISDIERLLRIHFVLTKKSSPDVGVIDFVQNLPDRIRKIKTGSIECPELVTGSVKGRVNWPKSFVEQQRRRGAQERTFVCSRTEREYDTLENLVLRCVLSNIHKIITQDLKPAIDEQRDWVEAWTANNEQLQNVLSTVFLRNIHIHRIAEHSPRLTQAQIVKVTRSRNILYREAAHLLLFYNKLLNYEIDPAEAKALLRNTFIQPDKTDVLFELYWVIKVIKVLSTKSLDVRFHIVDGSNNMVAEWTDSRFLYRVYHNSKGGPQLDFQEKFENLPTIDDDNYFSRIKLVLEEWCELKERHFGIASRGAFWQGRPDIIVEKYDVHDREHLIGAVLGEVKYTDRAEYAAQGLKELLEYMALVRYRGEYLSDRPTLFSNRSVRGVLFVDTIDKASINDATVRTIKFGESIEGSYFTDL